MGDGGGIESLRLVRTPCPFLRDLWPIDAALGDCAGVKAKDGRVTHLKIEGSAKAPCAIPELPAELGGLIGLVSLELLTVRQLVGLPETISNLSLLVTLNIHNCSALTSLPPTIGQLTKLETLDMFGCMKLTTLPPQIGQAQSLRAIKLVSCIALEALPPELGQLTGLKTLRLDSCVRLKELPPEMGTLTALTTLNIDKCKDLAFPPESLKNRPVDEIVGYLAAHLVVMRDVTEIAQPVTSWLHAKPQAVACFLNTIVTDPEYTMELSRAVGVCPSITDLKTKDGKSTLELAHESCRAAMESALFLLGRFEVDSGTPMHTSPASAVFAASDRQDGKGPRRALKALRDEAMLIAELKGRGHVENNVLVPILGVYVCTSAPTGEETVDTLYDGKVPLWRHHQLEEKIEHLLKVRRLSPPIDGAPKEPAKEPQYEPQYEPTGEGKARGPYMSPPNCPPTTPPRAPEEPTGGEAEAPKTANISRPERAPPMCAPPQGPRLPACG